MVTGGPDPDPSDEPKQRSNLDKYWHLSTAKTAPSRIEASSKLLKHCASNPDEVPYTLKRLLRGLASPLESSRQSFFVCLVEFLRQNLVDYDKVSQELRETLKVSGTQGEESLYLLGQILADVALLRAGRVKETRQYQQTLSRLLENGSKRVYLALISINSVVEYFLHDAPPLPVEEVVTAAGQSFELTLSEASLDTLYFVLATLNHFGAGISADFVQESFGLKDLTKKSSLAAITDILTKTTLPLANVVNHPVLKALVPLVSEKKTAKKLFSQLLPLMNTAYKGQIGIALLR